MTRSLRPSVIALFALVLCTASAQAALVAYYPLNGNFNDVKGGFNGASSGGTGFSAGAKGLGAEFDGVDDFVALTNGNNLGFANNWTVSAFIRPDVNGSISDKTILGNEGPNGTNEQMHLVLRGTGIHLGLYSNDQGPNGTVAVGSYQHVAFQMDGGNMRLFINGNNVGQSGGHSNFSATGLAKIVNMGKWNGGNFFDGGIDEVAIYNHALQPVDILHLSGGGDANSLPTQSQLPSGTGWISETFKRPGNAQLSVDGMGNGVSGNGFGGTMTVLDAINNGTRIGFGTVNTVNYFEPSGGGGTGNFGGDVEPFGLSGGADDHFVVRSTGFLQVIGGGNFQFRNNTDDGSRLRIDLNRNGVFEAGEIVILDDVLSGPHNADSAILALAAGQYKIEHIWFERDGGAEGDLGVSRNGGAFLLFGNPTTGGDQAFLNYGVYVTQEFQAVPEPASAMLALGGLAALGFRRRRSA